MTRDEAIQTLDRLIQQCADARITLRDGALLPDLRTYILNSIPTPTVEVVSKRGEYWDVNVNGEYVFKERHEADAEMTASMLRAALGIGGGE